MWRVGNYISNEDREVNWFSERELENVPALKISRSNMKQFRQDLFGLKKTQDFEQFCATKLGQLFFQTGLTQSKIDKIHNLAINATDRTSADDISDTYRQLSYKGDLRCLQAVIGVASIHLGSTFIFELGETCVSYDNEGNREEHYSHPSWVNLNTQTWDSINVKSHGTGLKRKINWDF